MSFITDFADQAVILPVAISVLLVLMVLEQWAVSLAWALSVCSVLGMILALKIVCYACGWLVPAFAADQLALLTPSGHAASAAVVYGSLVALPVRRHKFATACLAALACGTLVGVTRVRLGAHTPAEVVVAILIGIVGAGAFALVSGRLPTRNPSLPAFAAVAAPGLAVVWLCFHGLHLPAEQVIQASATRFIRGWVTACRPAPGLDGGRELLDLSGRGDAGQP